MILLTDASRPVEGVSADSFALALLLQLRPYNVDIQLSQWNTPATPEDQEGLASHRCRKTGAAAVIWCTLDPPWIEQPQGSSPRITVHIVSPWKEGFRQLSLAMGSPQEGIERSMATAVRTLVSAQLARPSQPEVVEPPPQPQPQPAPPPVLPRPSPPPRLEERVVLGAVYDLEVFPLNGVELRHGPSLVLGLRLFRGVRIQLGVGYRATNDGLRPQRWWSRDFLTVDLGVSHGWDLGRHLLVEAGGLIRATAVFSSAGTRPGDRQDSATLGELALGGMGSARLRIWSTLSALVRLRMTWLPVGHELTIGGDQVVEPGALEASVSMGLILDLL